MADFLNRYFLTIDLLLATNGQLTRHQHASRSIYPMGMVAILAHGKGKIN
jgi:hypothetical protein